MTVIARWDPFREFTTLQDRMNRLFRDSFGSDGRDEALTSTGFERSYSSFARSFTLPNTVDPSNVTADYDKGMLKITLASFSGTLATGPGASSRSL